MERTRGELHQAKPRTRGHVGADRRADGVTGCGDLLVGRAILNRRRQEIVGRMIKVTEPCWFRCEHFAPCRPPDTKTSQGNRRKE